MIRGNTLIYLTYGDSSDIIESTNRLGGHYSVCIVLMTSVCPVMSYHD